MSTPQILVLLGGFHALALAVFHLLFWRIFRWKTELSKLAPANRAIVQIFNIRLIYVFLFLAFICFFYPDDLIQTRLGRVILAGFSLFWLGRLLEQFIFLRKINHPMVHFLSLIFLLGTILFGLPLFL